MVLSSIFTPEILSFPNIPTTGGQFGFTFNFPCDYRRRAKTLYIERIELPLSFDTTRNQFVTYLDPGCGHFNISGGISILSTTYETGVITNVPILNDDKGILTIQDASHSSVTFSVEEFLTPNNWIIEVSICGSFYKSYSYAYTPWLTKMEGLLNDNGGNMVFIGNHLRPKYNATGTFGNKAIKCFTTNSPKNITCTIPSRKSYGSLGYNIPFTITIDGE
ncbi:hypothetical protein ACTFIY_004517 [Dictyostelium cf. discoideum]